jgi:hypothetical protein
MRKRNLVLAALTFLVLVGGGLVGLGIFGDKNTPTPSFSSPYAGGQGGGMVKPSSSALPSPTILPSTSPAAKPSTSPAPSAAELQALASAKDNWKFLSGSLDKRYTTAGMRAQPTFVPVTTFSCALSHYDKTASHAIQGAMRYCKGKAVELIASKWNALGTDAKVRATAAAFIFRSLTILPSKWAVYPSGAKRPTNDKLGSLQAIIYQALGNDSSAYVVITGKEPVTGDSIIGYFNLACDQEPWA